MWDGLVGPWAADSSKQAEPAQRPSTQDEHTTEHAEALAETAASPAPTHALRDAAHDVIDLVLAGASGQQTTQFVALRSLFQACLDHLEAEEARAREEAKAEWRQAKAERKGATEAAKRAAKTARLAAAEEKRAKKANVVEEEERKRKAEKAKAAAKTQELAAASAAKAAEEAQRRAQEAMAKAEAEAKAKAEKAAAEAEASAAKEVAAAQKAAEEAERRAKAAAAEARAAKDAADAEAEAGTFTSKEQKRAEAEASKAANKAAREAEKAEEARRRAEERAIAAAERHAEKQREKAQAALDAAIAATAAAKALAGGGGDCSAGGGRRVGGGGGAGSSSAISALHSSLGSGGATNIAGERLRRASSRLKRFTSSSASSMAQHDSTRSSLSVERLSAAALGFGGRGGKGGEDEEDSDGERDGVDKFGNEIIYSSSGWRSAAAEALAGDEHERRASLRGEEEEAAMMIAKAMATVEAEAMVAEMEPLARSTETAHERAAREALADDGVDAWRHGGIRSAQMDAHLLVQSDCVDVLGGGDLVCCVGGDGEGDGKALSIYSASRGVCVQSFYGHSERIDSVACDKVTGMIASGSRDKTVKLWSREKSECVGTLHGCEGAIYGLALCGDLVLTGEAASGDKGAGAKARLWRMSTLRCFAVLAEHKGSIWGASLSATRAVTAGHDAAAKIWSTAVPVDGHTRSLASLKHPKWVTSVSLQGETLATGSADAKVRLWSTESFKCMRVLDHGGGDELANVNWISVRLLGNAVLSGGQDGTVKLWAPRQAQALVATLSHGHGVRGVAAAGAVAAASDGASDIGMASFIVSAGGRSASSLVVWLPAGKTAGVVEAAGDTPPPAMPASTKARRSSFTYEHASLMPWSSSSVKTTK
jgi:hypothetical protein